MGSATVIAGLIAQGRGGLDPAGRVCRLALVGEDFGGVAARQRFPAARHAWGELAASRLSVQAIVAGR